MFKKLYVIITFCFIFSLLTGCSEENPERVIKDEVSLPFEDIRFDKGLIYLDTEEGTIVYYPSDIDLFSKTTEPSYINRKFIEIRSIRREWKKTLVTGEYPVEKKTVVYINDNLIKDVSKKYAEHFSRTLVFSPDME